MKLLAAGFSLLRCKSWLADIPALSEQVGDWPAWLRCEEEDAAVASLRRHTSTGRPLGSATFLNLLESMLGQTVRPRKAGRPKKTAKAA